MEDCIDDTPWLTDTERKLLDILVAFTVHFVRAATFCSVLNVACSERQFKTDLHRRFTFACQSGFFWVSV